MSGSQLYGYWTVAVAERQISVHGARRSLNFGIRGGGWHAFLQLAPVSLNVCTKTKSCFSSEVWYVVGSDWNREWAENRFIFNVAKNLFSKFFRLTSETSTRLCVWLVETHFISISDRRSRSHNNFLTESHWWYHFLSHSPSVSRLISNRHLCTISRVRKCTNTHIANTPTHTHIYTHINTHNTHKYT